MSLETLNAQLFLSFKSKGQVDKKYIFLLLCFTINLQGPVTWG